VADTVPATAGYGALDRLLHRLAFVHPTLQRVLGDVENDVFKKRLANVRVERPVFVTGLPRAGTTLVLELLYGTGEFASYTYRQMPFVLTPLLWDRLGAGSRRTIASRERAHGDAMMIDLDSPEAFEEVLWINHLADTLFDGDTMRPLGPADLTEEFRIAWHRLAAKLVCLAGEGGARAPRYLSKNNSNVARLPAVASAFGDAMLLCCFRHPAAHVASLHAQHRRFLRLHDEDPFARRYMAWIGHHDLGCNFRPIRFPNGHKGGAHDVRSIGAAFWLRYWIDAYRYALDTAPPRARFVRFEDFLENGSGALERLAVQAGLMRPSSLEGEISMLRAPTSTPEPLRSVSAPLADEAEALYRELSERSAEPSLHRSL